MEKALKDYSHLYLNNSIDKKLSEIECDRNKLFAAIVETSTKNQYKSKFYDGFIMLMESKMLTNYEKQIVKTVLEYYELNGNFPDLTYLKSNQFNSLKNKDYDDKRLDTLYQNPQVIPFMIEQFIKLQQTDCFTKQHSSTLKKIAKLEVLPLDFIYTLEDYRYSKKPFNTDKINLSFEYSLEDDKNVLCGYLDILDEYGKLKTGTINCLIKNKYADNFFEVSFIYNAVINERKNVCFVSTTWDSTDILNKLLSMHSYTLDESLHISYLSLCARDVDIEKVNKVLEDFKEKTKGHLIIFDNNSLNIFNQNTLRKLISETNWKFGTETGKGIELFIIDRIENLRLENNGELEENIPKIIKTYSNFIIRQSKMCFRDGFETMTIVFTTNTCCKSTYSYFKENGIMNNYDKDVEIVNSVLEKYSDMVITFALEKRQDIENKDLNGFIQVVKNLNNKTTIEPINVQISLESCKIKPKETSESKNEPVDNNKNVFKPEELKENVLKSEDLNNYINNIQKQ